MIQIAVALITTLGVVTVAMIQSVRHQNTREHGENARRLDRIISSVGRVEGKLDRHIDDHEKGTL